jgi:hypothetical protein
MKIYERNPSAHTWDARPRHQRKISAPDGGLWQLI